MNRISQSPYNFVDFFPVGNISQIEIPKELSFTYVLPFAKYENKNGVYTRRIDISITDENVDFEGREPETEAERNQKVEVLKVTAYGDSAGTDKLFMIKDLTRSTDRIMEFPNTLYSMTGYHMPYNIAFEIESNRDIREILTMAMVYNELLGGELISMSQPNEVDGKIVFRMFSVDYNYECRRLINHEILNLAAMIVTIMAYNPKNYVKSFGYAHNLYKKADAIAMDVTEAALQYVKTIFSIIEPNTSVRTLFTRSDVYDYKNRKYNTYMDWDEWMHKE